MSVLWLESGYTVKYSLSPREIPWAPPSGFPSGSGYISLYIPPLVTIQTQYIPPLVLIRIQNTLYSFLQCTLYTIHFIHLYTQYSSADFHQPRFCRVCDVWCMMYAAEQPGAGLAICHSTTVSLYHSTTVSLYQFTYVSLPFCHSTTLSIYPTDDNQNFWLLMTIYMDSIYIPQSCGGNSWIICSATALWKAHTCRVQYSISFLKMEYWHLTLAILPPSEGYISQHTP